MRKVCGFGVNDISEGVSHVVDGKRVVVPFYAAWKSMIQRCYSDKFQNRCPTYVGVEVCTDWARLSTFKEWFDTNSVSGWQLDKDILTDEKIYSPSTCIFIPRWLNTFIIGSGASRGAHPIGVCFDVGCGKFKSSCRNGLTGVVEHIGYFDSPDAAHQAWKSRKLEMAINMKREMDAIDERIYNRVVDLIKSLR